MNGTIQCAQEMGLVNVHWECDYPRYPGKGTSQSALGKGLANVPWEWD